MEWVKRARTVTLLLALLAIASCSGPTTPAALAKSLCHSAFGDKALNSAPGNVQDLRTLMMGPFAQPPLEFAHAFPNAGRNQTIGWCWTESQRSFSLYAVTAGYKPVRVEGLRGTVGNKTPPPGPEQILPP